VTSLYDDTNLLDDPDYATAPCGLIVHVDDLATHGDEPCELCEERNPR
jgi:hypothetical protein